MVESEELLPWSGVIAVIVTIGSTLLATVVSPAFVWRENALSNLGVTGTNVGTIVTAVLFNGGLIVGGLLGLVFCLGLARRAADRIDQLVVILLGVTLVLMALIGVFPQNTSPHAGVASLFFFMITVTLLAEGFGAVRDGANRWGAISLVAGAVNLGVWIAWGTAGPVMRDGLAIPEIAGAVVFGGWVAVRAFRAARQS
jgi:hypothetical membrane protein